MPRPAGQRAEIMHIYKVLPDLSKRRHMGLWHEALRAQWSPDDAVQRDLPKRSSHDRLIAGQPVPASQG